MMQLVRDWMRRWPQLTLTGEQIDTLEELIEEDRPVFTDEERSSIEWQGFMEGFELMRDRAKEAVSQCADDFPKSSKMVAELIARIEAIIA
jgi:hypothetical protein